MANFSIWGRYETRDVARLACNRFEDQPGAWYRVRYMPNTSNPEYPYAVLVYDYKEDANAVDAEGEVR